MIYFFVELAARQKVGTFSSLLVARLFHVLSTVNPSIYFLQLFRRNWIYRGLIGLHWLLLAAVS